MTWKNVTQHSDKMKMISFLTLKWQIVGWEKEWHLFQARLIQKK